MLPGAPRLILASGSVTRKALMQAAGLRFDARAVDVDEAALKAAMQHAGCDVAEAALALADAKAAEIKDPEAWVIGADQILLCQGRWFDKPADLAAARQHLQALRGHPHELVTAVACWRGGQRHWHHVARPSLTMRGFSDPFLDAYLAAEGNAVLSSVGAYRLEGLGLQLFDAVAGEHAAILGLPMLDLLGYLRQVGVIRS